MTLARSRRLGPRTPWHERWVYFVQESQRDRCTVVAAGANPAVPLILDQP